MYHPKLNLSVSVLPAQSVQNYMPKCQIPPSHLSYVPIGLHAVTDFPVLRRTPAYTYILHHFTHTLITLAAPPNPSFTPTTLPRTHPPLQLLPWTVHRTNYVFIFPWNSTPPTLPSPHIHFIRIAYDTLRPSEQYKTGLINAFSSFYIWIAMDSYP